MIDTRRKGLAGEQRMTELMDQAYHSAAEYGNLHPSTLHVVLSLYRAFALLDRNQTEELSAVGLSCPQFNALAVLHRAGQPVTMGELANMMAIQPTNLSGIVKALRGKGLVRQDLNGADHRSLVVTITEEGEHLLTELLPDHWARLEDIFATLTKSEREGLARLLDKLVASIRSTEPREG